ncbi:MAG: CoA-binding protein [Sulfolobales archaeon]
MLYVYIYSYTIVLGVAIGAGGVISRLRSIESVAIVGASPIEGKVGFELLRNVVKFGFEGRVYPVNPKYDEVLGFKCYKTPREIPDKVDLGVVAVPAPQVPGVVRDLCKRDAEVSVIVSAGFRERGRSDLEELVRSTAIDCGMRVVGPNSAGVTSSPSKLHASIEVMPSPGRVAVVSHSGAVGGVAMYELQKLNSGVSYFVSVGNSVDVSVEEVLEELAEDPYTDAVVAYVEWVRDGRWFLQSLRKLSYVKPVAIVKGGWGEASSRAVASHTGGMAAPYEVFKAAVRQSGAVLVDEVEDAVSLVEVLRRLRVGKALSRVLVVTNSGGYGILVASHLESVGVVLPQVGSDLRERVEVAVGREFSGGNPVDFGGDSRSSDVVKTLLVDGVEQYFDAAVVVYVPTSAESPREICESFKQVEERLPTVYLVAGGGASWISHCLSELKPVVTRVSTLSKLFSVLNRSLLAKWGGSV